jgi:hypothetical protein
MFRFLFSILKIEVHLKVAQGENGINTNFTTLYEVLFLVLKPVLIKTK